jgi:hypothetical protein
LLCSDVQAFARKLVHHWAEAKDVDNEVKVLSELCKWGPHPHIVSILRTGKLLNSRYVFIDMELCDLNLQEYVYSTKPRDSVPTFFIKDQPPPMKARQNLDGHGADRKGG